MADRIKGITIEIGGDTTGLDKALKGVNQELKETQNGLKDVNKLLKMDPGNIDLLRQKQGYLKDAISETEKKLATEKEALEQLKNSDGFDKNSEQAKALERQIIADEQALKDLKQQAKDFGNVASQVFKNVGDKVKDVGDKVKGVGTTMSKSVTAPIAAIGAASIAAFNEVDSAMDTLITKTGATGEAFEDMQKAVEDIATEIPTSFETAANAVGEVNTRFGVTGQSLYELSEQFVKFAEVNNTDVVSSIDSTQKALSAFGLGAEDAYYLLDVLNVTGQKTGTSMDSLLSGLIQNGTAFQEMGLSIEEATYFMGQMELSGADMSAVMSGLSKALKNATADGIPLDKALSDLQDTIVNGTESTDGLTEAYDLFGKSGAAVYEAVKNGTLDFQSLGEAADNVAGSVFDTFESTLDPADKWTTAMNQAKLAGADLGSTIQEAALPIVEKLSDLIQKLTDKFRSLTPEQQQTIVKIGAIVAAIGPALVIIGTLISSVGSIISVLGTLIGILGGPLTIAITAAIAIGVLLYKNWDTIKEKATALFQAIDEKFTKIKDSITEKITAAKDAVHDMIEKIKGFFNFEWKLPHLAMPHFSVSGSINPMDWLTQGVPHINVEWYRKGYQNGVIFNQPTVLQTPSGYKGFGDGNGSEVVLGLNKLKELVGSGGDTNIQINVYGAEGQDVRLLAKEVERELVNIQNQRSAVWA